MSAHDPSLRHTELDHKKGVEVREHDPVSLLPAALSHSKPLLDQKDQEQ